MQWRPGLAWGDGGGQPGTVCSQLPALQGWAGRETQVTLAAWAEAPLKRALGVSGPQTTQPCLLETAPATKVSFDFCCPFLKIPLLYPPKKIFIKHQVHAGHRARCWGYRVEHDVHVTLPVARMGVGDTRRNQRPLHQAPAPRQPRHLIYSSWGIWGWLVFLPMIPQRAC